MANAGSLIQLHYHNNQTDVLDFLSDVDGNLYYKNTPIYTQVSSDPKNAIVKLPDGIFVDGSYFLTQREYEVLTQFSFENSELKFKDKTISWDYDLVQLQLINSEIWEILNAEFPENSLFNNAIYTGDGKVLMTADNNVFSGKGDS